ncbi:LysM peptidoglycan-binding domain-containing protein [Bacillus sp. ISL-35]|uniref:LysM peptidoglycan-binding domain-containing protein n=1 Tax=Bacillus sp. ISL-35 TaxID=2819122 RepID=UPI001BEBC93F|nr:LysM peptidoglycan-binding domain-containing protein [Bacillus sp. ISL-35]MBT2704610.1 LysM peptidoglycan-binding domain-containing protein [Chryseobacterium sp. ISL-80]
MNREKPIRDQAERLRKRVERKSESKVEKKDALPPRSEIHRQKQKKTKVKVKYPVIRLMALFFILLPISFFSILSYLDGKEGPLNKTLERAGVEMINVESKEDGKDTNQEEEEEAAPVFEEVSESTDEIEAVAAAPSPATSNKGDKDSTDATSADGEKETVVGQSTDAPEQKDEQAAPASSSSSDQGEAASGETILYHTVKPSETLFRVAMTYYKSQDGIPIIQKANNLKGNEIEAGQVLKIPIKN